MNFPGTAGAEQGDSDRADHRAAGSENRKSDRNILSDRAMERNDQFMGPRNRFQLFVILIMVERIFMRGATPSIRFCSDAQ